MTQRTPFLKKTQLFIERIRSSQFIEIHHQPTFNNWKDARNGGQLPIAFIDTITTDCPPISHPEWLATSTFHQIAGGHNIPHQSSNLRQVDAGQRPPQSVIFIKGIGRRLGQKVFFWRRGSRWWWTSGPLWVLLNCLV